MKNLNVAVDPHGTALIYGSDGGATLRTLLETSIEQKRMHLAALEILNEASPVTRAGVEQQIGQWEDAIVQLESYKEK